jgi:plastocyanin
MIFVITTLVGGVTLVSPSVAFTPSTNITNFTQGSDSASQGSPPSPGLKMAPITNTIISLGSSFPDNKNFFVPSKLSVDGNTTVIWTNNDTILHTVTSGNPYLGPSNQFDSSYLEPTQKYNHTFTKAGDFEYYCTLHPFMTGEVTVTKQAEPIMTIVSPEDLPTRLNVIVAKGSSFPSNGKFFVPADVGIAPNGTIVWTNEDAIIHTVTSGKPRQGPSGEFDSGIIQSGHSFNHTFSKRGAYDYYSSLHPYMIGKVIVGFYSYNLQVDGRAYPIHFLITGNGNHIQKISLQPINPILEIRMVSASPGNMTIVIPRTVLDRMNQNGIDETFGVIGNTPIGFNEISSTPISRTLAIQFDAGTNYMQLLGSTAFRPVLKSDVGVPLPKNETFQRQVQLIIPRGASEQGNLPFEPSILKVKAGDKVTITNKDLIPHSVTSGTGPDDRESGVFFDSSIIEGAKSSDIATSNLAPGDYDFFCIIHPFMKGKLQVLGKNLTLSIQPGKVGTELIGPKGILNNVSKQPMQPPYYA